MAKKYTTEEERITALREQKKKWYQANKEKVAEWYQKNKEKIAEYRKVNKEKIAEYRKANKDKISARMAEYYQANKERIAEKKAEYDATPIGRAAYLLRGYIRKDKKYKRGECTLTAQWIVDNIFTKPCHYCGETDWRKIGCDRIYNYKPHTMDNVVPCCTKCNRKRGRKEYNKFVEIMSLNEGKKEDVCISQSGVQVCSKFTSRSSKESISGNGSGIPNPQTRKNLHKARMAFLRPQTYRRRDRTTSNKVQSSPSGS